MTGPQELEFDLVVAFPSLQDHLLTEEGRLPKGDEVVPGPVELVVGVLRREPVRWQALGDRQVSREDPHMQGSHTSTSARHNDGDDRRLQLVSSVSHGLPEQLAGAIDGHLATFAEHVKEGLLAACGGLAGDGRGDAGRGHRSSRRDGPQ